MASGLLSSRVHVPAILAVAALLLNGSCSRTPRGAAQRVAILGIDNLSGDPSLDWVSAAAPRIVASELSGASAVAVPSESDAYAAGATRFVYGYFDRRGGAPLHFEFEVEDAESHRMQDVMALNANPIQALDTLARRLDPSAQAFSTADLPAIEAFGQGDYQHAVQLDPNFSAAWLAWAQSLAGPDPAKAADITTQALAQPGLRNAADRSRLELLAASLTHDPESELKALQGLAAQSQPDPNSLRALAETAMNARDFTQAANYYQSLLRLAPTDLSAQNLLGYAYAFAGDLDSSMKAFDIYRHQPGQEPNALDSMGEAYFVNGRFADAERFFLEADNKDAAMLGGGDLLKAAYAHYLASRNAAAADPIFNRFAAARAQAKDPILEWKKAAWLYGTGRADRAKAALETALRSIPVQPTTPAAPPDPASIQFTALARKQLAVWNAPPTAFGDLGQLKRAYQSSTPSTDGLARTFYAEALLAGGQREQAQKLTRTWPLPDTAGDPVLQPFLYPRFLELREKLK